MTTMDLLVKTSIFLFFLTIELQASFASAHGEPADWEDKKSFVQVRINWVYLQEELKFYLQLRILFALKYASIELVKEDDDLKSK